MGSNTYLATPSSKGHTTGSTATAITQIIEPRAGERIAIRAFGFTAGTSISSVYFMQELGQSTITTAVASNATTGFVLNDTLVTGNLLGTSDYVALELDDGTYQVVTIATGASSNFSVGTALTDDMAAGKSVRYFGVFGDTPHIKFNLDAAVGTVKAQTAKELDGGIFYSNGVGKAMLVYHANDTAASPGDIDYLTIDYINV